MPVECPLCKCETFYVKDPADEFEVYEFSCPGEDLLFSADVDPQQAPDVTPQTETYCNQCAWHGKYETLKTRGD